MKSVLILMFILVGCSSGFHAETKTEVVSRKVVNPEVPMPTPAPGSSPTPQPTPPKAGLPSTPAPGPKLFPTLAREGTIPLTLVADQGASQNQVVSLGVPFPPQTLNDFNLIRLIDPNTQSEIPIQVQLLTRWPLDQSVRSVLVMFRTTLAHRARRTLEIQYGRPAQTTRLTGLTINPDGPIVATLPPKWYGESLVSGRLLPVSENRDFTQYESQLRRDLAGMSPSFQSYRVSCEVTENHRTYYDSPHGLYQLFLRTADPSLYRRARLESRWFRANELTWYQNRTMAVQICQDPNWNPTIKLEWYVLRRMIAQGSLDDYQLTGDPAAREAVLGMGEAYLRNLPTLARGTTLEATERNLAWPLMGLVSYYAVRPSEEIRRAIDSLVERAMRWQNRGRSGAFEHDLAATDPDVCAFGPRGASPFMTSLMVEALVEYYTITRDPRIGPMLVRIAAWYRDHAQLPGEYSFVYLWGCETNQWPSQAVLNTFIVHVFGATYVLSGDSRWLEYGDRVAQTGQNALWTGRPKDWSMAARTFGRYLAYRRL